MGIITDFLKNLHPCRFSRSEFASKLQLKQNSSGIHQEGNLRPLGSVEDAAQNFQFWHGVICGVLAAILIFSIIAGLKFFNRRDKELVEYAEKQIEIEALREDYTNRDYADFLEVPDVRRAADGAAAEFDRKRDEALQRFRSGLAD